MSLFDKLCTVQNGSVLSFLSYYYGLSHEDAKRAVAATAFEINTALSRASTAPDTLIPVLKMIGNARLQDILNKPTSLSDPEVRQKGLEIFHTLLGSSAGRHKLAQQVTERTALPAGLVEHMLPTLVAVTMSVLQQETSAPMSGLLTNLSRGKINGANERNPFERLARFIDERRVRENTAAQFPSSIRSIFANFSERSQAVRHA